MRFLSNAVAALTLSQFAGCLEQHEASAVEAWADPVNATAAAATLAQSDTSKKPAQATEGAQANIKQGQSSLATAKPPTYPKVQDGDEGSAKIREPKKKVKVQYFRIANTRDKKAYIVLSHNQLEPGIFEARVSEGTDSWRSVFQYDKRTKSIRNFKMATHALSATDSGDKYGTAAEFREFKNRGSIDQHIERQGQWIKQQDLCLASENQEEFENSRTIWAGCENKEHMAWTLRSIAV